MENFLQELAVLAARTVDGGLICGITTQPPDGGPVTVASSEARQIVISVSGEPPQPGPFGSH